MPGPITGIECESLVLRYRQSYGIVFSLVVVSNYPSSSSLLQT